MRVRAEDVHLTPTEFDLLVCLANSRARCSPASSCWPRCGTGRTRPGTRTVDSHIKALRRKIGAERIRTVHGVGYALETPDAMRPAPPGRAGRPPVGGLRHDAALRRRAHRGRGAVPAMAAPGVGRAAALDPFSIKAKLGALVVVSVLITTGC